MAATNSNMPWLDDRRLPAESDAVDAVKTVIIDCELKLRVGEKLIKLDCSCQPGFEYAAINALTEELRKRIVLARNRELAGIAEELTDGTT